jgi:hypothetical protein
MTEFRITFRKNAVQTSKQLEKTKAFRHAALSFCLFFWDFFLINFQSSEFNKDSWCLSLCITEAIQSRAFSLWSMLHFCMNEMDRNIHTSGEETTKLLKIKSFLINHRFHARQPNKKTNSPLSLFDPSTNLQCMSSMLSGMEPHSRTSLSKF